MNSTGCENADIGPSLVAARRDASSGGGRPGAALARFHEARGQRVVEAEGVLWAQYRPPFYVSLPYEARMDLDPRSLATAMRASHIAAVRYPTLTQPGVPSGLFFCDTRSYSLERVEARHRRQVQKALRLCHIRTVDPDELLACGLELNLDTMARQRRFDREFGTPSGWRRFVRAVRACPEVTVAGAFLAGRLSAYAVVCRDGALLHLLFKNTLTADMIHRTNPALDFAVLASAARDPTLSGVANGALSLIRGAEGLHRYKQTVGYRIVPHALAILLHPRFAPVLTAPLVVGAARGLSKLRPSSKRLDLVAQVLSGARISRAAEGAPVAARG